MDRRVYVILASHLRRGGLPADLPPRTSWALLARSIQVRDLAVALLGLDAYVDQQPALDRTARNFVDIIVERVGEIGSRQPDHLDWWWSKFASRSPWQTLFFARAVTLAVANGLVARPPTTDSFVLVVEDPVVFEALRLGEHLGLRCVFLGRGGSGNLGIWLLVPVKRVATVAYALLLKALAVLVLAAARRPRRPPAADVAVHSYLEERTLPAGGAYRDEYLGAVASILESAGLRLTRVSNLLPPPRLIVRAVRHPKLWPLILSLPVSPALRGIFRRWRPVGLEALQLPGIEGSQIRILIQAEHLAEWRSGYIVNYLTWHALLAYVAAVPTRAIVYPFENQPWEKLLCLAVRRSGRSIRLAAVQHSLISELYVGFFRSRHDSPLVCPDVILASGVQMRRLLCAHGWEPERVVVAGALRYARVFAEPSPTVLPGGRTVLVSLPVEEDISAEIVAALAASFPDGGAVDGLRLVVRPHPVGKRRYLRKFRHWLMRAGTDGRPFDALLRSAEAGCVLTARSTSGIEALFCGIPVVRFKTALNIDMDPFQAYSGEGIAVTNAQTLGQTIRTLLCSGGQTRRVPHEDLRGYLSEPVSEVVLEAVEGSVR